VNRALKRISIAILVMFLLLLINLNYLQGFDTTALSQIPYNSRTIAANNQYQRGEITTADGQVMAESRADSSSVYQWQRYYPNGPLYSPITGWDSLAAGTETGLESQYNSYLSGQSSSLAFRNIIDLITGKTRKGATVVTTINSSAQQAAYSGLQSALSGSGRVGGVVAMDPKTGAILAMASYPSYDPNKVSQPSSTKPINKYIDQMQASKGDPLVNHATESTFPPGSTFKIVTSSAWFTQSSSNTPNSMVSSPTTLSFSDSSHILHNDQNGVCGNGSGTTTLIQAFTESCDTTFAKLGEDIGTGQLNTMAGNYGFNNSGLSLSGIPVAASQYVQTASLSLTAMSAIGQYSDTVTALQEAMLSSAIANGGTLMKPYLVQQVQASDLSNVSQTSPTILSHAVSPSVASNVQTMMESVVNSPSGTAYGVSGIHSLGVQIAGKTGTAENGVNSAGLNDAVFTCYTVNGNRPIAVGVIVQGGGFGAAAAAPIAVQVIKAYLGSK
jgi:peptidoglycan glycosyltransferase